MANKASKQEAAEVEAAIEDTAEVKEIPEIDSKYRMILLAAQRSKQLQRGANPRVSTDTKKHKPTRIAMDEIKNKKVHFEILDEE